MSDVGAGYVPEHEHNPMSQRQRLSIVWCIRLVEGSQFLLAYMFAPFFPQKAAELGMTSSTMVGAVFAIYSLGSMLATPIVTPFFSRFGSRKTLMTGWDITRIGLHA